MKINLGSGNTRIEGFVNVDSDINTNPDILCDIQENLPFDDNSIEEVRAYHILEHIGDKFFGFMKELYRVCKPDTIIDVRVPHHRHDYFYGDPSHVRPITIENMKRFSKSEGDLHTGLQNFGALLNIDFSIVWHQYIFEPYFEDQFKTLSDEQCNMMARMYNNVIQEIHFKMRVIK